jgi:hypothetical protein
MAILIIHSIGKAVKEDIGDFNKKITQKKKNDDTSNKK